MPPTDQCINLGNSAKGYRQTLRGGRYYLVHRLLCALTHNLSYDDDTWQARHTCDNKSCIRVEHIIPGTRLDNARDAVERGQQPRGERHGRARLTDEQVEAIRVDTRTQQAIADDYGINRSMVSHIKKGIRRGK